MSAVTPMIALRVGARGLCIGLSNALDRLDSFNPSRSFRAGAPPGPLHGGDTRGPDEPALGILGGPQMTP